MMNIRELYRFKRYFEMAGFEPIIDHDSGRIAIWGTDSVNVLHIGSAEKAYAICYTLADHFILPEKVKKIAKRYLRYHRNTQSDFERRDRNLSYNEFYRMKAIIERAGDVVTVKYLPVPALFIGKYAYITRVSGAEAHFRIYKKRGNLPPWAQFILDEDL